MVRTAWMRWTGRLLAVAWAGFGSCFAVASSFGGDTALYAGFLPVLVVVLVFFGSAYIACRWESIGGKLLLAEGLLMCAGDLSFSSMDRRPTSRPGCCFCWDPRL